MNERQSAVGEIFKQRRKERNLSLKEAENATSIRMSYLQAIEDGDMHKLISPVYAQGFVKHYASYLGIDSEELFRQHPEMFGRPAKQVFDYGIGTLEVRGNPGAGVKWLPNAVWIAAFAVMLIVAWALARFLDVI